MARTRLLFPDFQRLAGKPTRDRQYQNFDHVAPFYPRFAPLVQILEQFKLVSQRFVRGLVDQR